MAVEGENLGVATIYVTVDTTNMDAGITKSKLTLAGMGAEAQKQYDAMSVGQQKVAINLARQIELMGKSTAQQKAYYAQQKLGGALGADLAKQALAQEQALTAAREEEATSAQKIIAAEAEARAAQQARYDTVMAQERELAAAYEAEAAARRAATAPVDTALTPVAARSSAARAGDPLVMQQIADYAALDAIMGKKVATTEEVAAAEAALDRLQAQGMISNEELADSFAALDVVTAAETKSLQANSVAQLENATATKINSRTQYELGVLLGETASGNTSRIKRSIPALLNSMHLTEKLFSPIGLGIAGVTLAVGTLAAAFAKGEAENAAFNNALILTGDYSGKSSAQLQSLAIQLDNLHGVTEHAAAGVVTQVAATGKFYGDQVQMVSTAALQMQQATGQSIETTIKQFEQLGADPVGGILKLDDTMHFLTQAVYDQITALVQQGETEQAAAVAQQAYAGALATRTQSVLQNVGLLQSAWAGLKNAVKETWDAMLDVGRSDAGANLQMWQRQLDVARQNMAMPGLDDATIRAFMQQANEAQQQIDNLSGKTDADVKQTSDALKAQQELTKGGLTTLQQYMASVTHYTDLYKKAIVGASDAAKASALSALNVHLAAAKETYDSATRKATPKPPRVPKDNSDKLRQMAIDDINKQAAAEDKETEAQQRSAQEIKVFTDNLQAQLRTRQETLNLQVAAVGMGDKEVQQQQELLAITQQYEQKQEQLDRQHADKSRGMTDDQYAQESAALKAHYQNDLSLTTQHYADIDAAQANWANGAEKAIANFHDQAANVAGQTAAVFNTAFSDMTDALMTFVTTSKLSFKSLVTDVLKGIAEMELKAAESKLFSLVGNMIASYFGGGVSAGGGIDTGGSGTVAFGSSAVGSANGNIFAGPGIAAYENQIVAKPTFFARGGNVMGEAGPEAIIPLSRDSGGRLGIKSAGGGNTININTQVTVDQSGARSKTSSDSSDAAARQLGAMMEAKAKEVVGRAIQPGGILWRHGVGQAA